jgi:chromosomal replication initiator protein
MRVRGCQLLAIDELDKLPNERHLLEELRYLLDDRAASGRLTLVASQHATARLANLSPEVRSRLAAGLVLQLSAPGPAARAQILMQAADALGTPLSREAARRLAADAEDARDLFRSLFELLSTSPETSAIHGNALRDHLAHRNATRVSLREIIPVVARYYGLPQKLLKSASRKQSIVLARATIVYLARALAHVSYEEIGQALGGRDHSTIMHNYRTIDRDRKRNTQLQETLDDLRRLLAAR